MKSIFLCFFKFLIYFVLAVEDMHGSGFVTTSLDSL